MLNKKNKSQHTTDSDYRIRQLQKEALDRTAEAVKTIDRYHEETVLQDADYQGNVTDAKTYAGATMVHLALSAGKENEDKVNEILSGYGLERLL